MILSLSVRDPVSSSLVALLGVVFIPKVPLWSKRAAVVMPSHCVSTGRKEEAQGEGLASSF